MAGKKPGYDRDIWRDMAELGWTGLLVPERHGGSGLTVSDMALVAQRLAAHLSPEPLSTCAVLAARTLCRCEETPLAGSLLAQISSGETVAALAFQEHAGQLLGSTSGCRISESGGSFELGGEKRFVAGGADADGFVVSGDTGAGAVLVWVSADSKGLDVRLDPLADGRFSATLGFNAVEIGAENFLARENTAGAALIGAVNETTVIACAELIGLMGAALDMTLEYLRTRVQFGKAIGSFQGLQHRAVDLFIAQQLATASLSDALQALSHEPDAAQTMATISRAKARCSDSAALITREAIQMHGAIGFTEDSDVGLYVKRALTLGAWLGNSAFHRRRFLELTPNLDT